MFLAWSKQLENEGMGSRMGVLFFFISQSVSSILAAVYKLFVFFFILDYSLHSSESLFYSYFCHGATFLVVFASFHGYSTMIEYLHI